MRRILTEPLLHFAVLGLGLFALYPLVTNDAPPASGEIVVDAPRVAALAQNFERSWRRPPSEEEVAGLVESYVREEVLYREGLAQGLDRDDSVIRSRVVLRMEVIGAEPETPITDGELQAWFDANAARYATPARYDVRQIFFDPVRRGPHLDANVAAALRELERNPTLDSHALGDATLLPGELAGVTRTDVAAQYGEELAQALTHAASGRWFGPVTSSYGDHLMLVDVREPARAMALADVRDEAERDFSSARAQSARDALYLRLRERYTIRIEASQAGGRDAALAAESR